jgi:hypothetical protein
MSEIFYSQVDAALQQELNARGRAGKTDRSNEALNFMLGKIANIQLIAYEQAKKDKNQLHTLGGVAVRSGEYLPTGTTQFPGFLDDRVTKITDTIWTSTNGVLDTDNLTSTYKNTTKRIPPYITSADVNIGDHSMGLLNKATINIKIPNPQQDFDFFETVWLRPGRPVDIIIEHPKSAVITQGLLSGSLPSAEKIKKLNPNADIQKIREMNRHEFSGLITNFTFSYEPDASVTVTINLTGTSNVYTDVSLLMNTDKKEKNQIILDVSATSLSGQDPSSALSIDQSQSVFNLFENSNFSTNSSITVPAQVPTIEIEETPVNRSVLSIYSDLETELENVINKETDAYKLNPYTGEYLESAVGQLTQLGNDVWYTYGEPYPTAKNKDTRYITLAWLINYLNRVIIRKRKDATPDADPLENLILCTKAEDLCTSNYYEQLVSANPDEILLINANNKLSRTYGDIIYYERVNFGFNFQENNIAYPSLISINMRVIKNIIDTYKNIKTQFNVNSFLKDISLLIKRNTGGAINMALITHPEIPNTLLYYDCNRVRFNENITPYSVPMFANDLNGNGTIVRDFKFSAKIPDSVKTLSYVLNQNPEEISEEDVAPYMNFMYNSSNVVRKNNGTRTSTGILEETQNAERIILLEKINKQWKEKYEKYTTELDQAKQDFGKNPDSDELQLQLRQALVKYIQYPTPSVTQTNQITAPIYPFDAELTIDGINGFRYGDVLEFQSLPARFRNNTVFSIINITHTVSTSGEWTTKLKCIMRPKFE